MRKSRLSIVNGPEFDYCTDYNCAGDCGNPHNDKERAAYVAHALATFDALKSDARRPVKDVADAVRRAAKERF